VCREFFAVALSSSPTEGVIHIEVRCKGRRIACIGKLDRDEHSHSPLLAIAILLKYTGVDAILTLFNTSAWVSDNCGNRGRHITAGAALAGMLLTTLSLALIPHKVSMEYSS
jgi:hypothetical protein